MLVYVCASIVIEVAMQLQQQFLAHESSAVNMWLMQLPQVNKNEVAIAVQAMLSHSTWQQR